MQPNTDLFYKEKVPHGHESFPIKLYHTTLKEPDKGLYLHWHDEFEMIYVANGNGVFVINLVDYHGQKGDVFFMKPGSLHAVYGDEIEGCECYTIIVHPNFLKSAHYDKIEELYLNPFMKEEISFLPLHRHNPKLQQLMQDIITQLKTQPIAYELIVKGLCFQLFGTLYENHQVNTQVRTSKKAIALKTVLAHIHQNYHRKLTIHELAQLVGYSDYHFIRFFKQETNMNCIDYINHIRLQHAHQLLASTNDSITEIAYNCGFENLSYFTKKFKEKYNHTPSKSRRK